MSTRKEVSREVYEELHDVAGIKTSMEMRYFIEVVDPREAEAECGWVTGKYIGTVYRSKCSAVRLTKEWESRLLTLEHTRTTLFERGSMICKFIEDADPVPQARVITSHFDQIFPSVGDCSKTLTALIELGILEFKNP
jgi:hypothetical protein